MGNVHFDKIADTNMNLLACHSMVPNEYSGSHFDDPVRVLVR